MLLTCRAAGSGSGSTQVRLIVALSAKRLVMGKDAPVCVELNVTVLRSPMPVRLLLLDEDAAGKVVGREKSLNPFPV